MKKTKNRAPVLCVALLAGLVFPGLLQAEDARDRNRLYIYNWVYYIPLPIIKKFEEEYGVTVIYDTFDSEADMYARIADGGWPYDIVFSSQEYTSTMISQGMFERLDRSKLPNLRHLDPAVLRKLDYDPGMDYVVPYYFGAPCIVVNTAMVPQFERSWSIFARSDLEGHMAMLDDMREALGGALNFLGYSANTRKPSEINAARDLVNAKWKPNLYPFDAEIYADSYAYGDVWVFQGYPEVVFMEIDAKLRENTVFFIPSEGGLSYLDSMGIPKDSKNIDLAHQFIDFIHRPEIYAEFTDYYHFPSTVNIPARSLKTEAPLITEEEMLRTELKHSVGEALDYYIEAWDSIR